MSFFRLFLFAIALGFFGVACGNNSVETADERDELILEWGRAKLTGDLGTMLELLEPAAGEELSASPGFEQLLNVPQPEVELNDFGYRIESEIDDAVEVAYLGERCAQTTSTSFTETTVVGDGSSASNGEVTFGEVECVDLSQPSRFPLDRFVLVDGTWYATLAVPGS